tara:strand:+ start:366 stop:608 length:243 start_codon:yes stop_codon:yes gene_type:complete
MLKTIKEKSREDLLKENEDLYSRLQQLRGKLGQISNEMESYRQAYWGLVKHIENYPGKVSLDILGWEKSKTKKGGNENDK